MISPSGTVTVLGENSSSIALTATVAAPSGRTGAA
jgi:hypothetical protein